MSGPEEGPRLFKTTASNIISRMWWRHASHNSSRFSFCSSKVQAPLSRPVLLERKRMCLIPWLILAAKNVLFSLISLIIWMLFVPIFLFGKHAHPYDTLSEIEIVCVYSFFLVFHSSEGKSRQHTGPSTSLLGPGAPPSSPSERGGLGIIGRASVEEPASHRDGRPTLASVLHMTKTVDRIPI
ncbi:unnamed protein product, partial [Nesidiocoris tenuis]